jgi:predicted RNase H-like nuclease (RuvC/YqgF family)
VTPSAAAVAAATPVTIMIAIFTVLIGAGAFWFSTRSARATADAAEHAVDASAYNRATSIYESTIAMLRTDVDRLTVEIRELRASNERILEDVATLRGRLVEMHELEESNRLLVRENKTLRQRCDELRAALGRRADDRVASRDADIASDVTETKSGVMREDTTND